MLRRFFEEIPEKNSKLSIFFKKNRWKNVCIPWMTLWENPRRNFLYNSLNSFLIMEGFLETFQLNIWDPLLEFLKKILEEFQKIMGNVWKNPWKLSERNLQKNSRKKGRNQSFVIRKVSWNASDGLWNYLKILLNLRWKPVNLKSPRTHLKPTDTTETPWNT